MRIGLRRARPQRLLMAHFRNPELCIAFVVLVLWAMRIGPQRGRRSRVPVARFRKSQLCVVSVFPGPWRNEDGAAARAWASSTHGAFPSVTGANPVLPALMKLPAVQVLGKLRSGRLQRARLIYKLGWQMRRLRQQPMVRIDPAEAAREGQSSLFSSLARQRRVHNRSQAPCL